VWSTGPPSRFESDPAAALQILLVDPKKVFQQYRSKADVRLGTYVA